MISHLRLMEHKTNTAIGFFILFIWGILVVFGVFTIISPDWLTALSNPGKNVEAISFKDAGDQSLKAEKYQLAISQYKSALKIVPDLKSAIANLAVAYQRSGNFSKSIIAFKHLLTLEPEYPEVIYYNMGEMYEKSGQTEKAVSSYLKSAEEASFPEKSYQKAGQIYMDTERFDEAIVCYNKALEHKYTIENAYRGMLLNQQKVLADSNITFERISVILSTEQQPEVFSKYDRLVFKEQLGSDLALAKTYNNIGFCLAKQAKYELSLPYFSMALSMFPNYTEARNNKRFVDRELANQ